MSKGTFFLVSENERESFPELRMMISTGLAMFNDAENIAAREPTTENMDILTPADARKRWGKALAGTRIWTVEGNTLLINDPRQFLRHYYHFVAELFFGAWAFWHGGWSKPSPSYAAIYDPSIPTPPLHRAIFAHTDGEGWRDVPGFDRWFLRGVFPSLTVETEEDWKDRIEATSDGSRAWHFPVLLLADRSAAHRGPVCGPNQRTASEAWQYMKDHNQLMGVNAGGWWAPIRQAVWKFAGILGDPEAVGHSDEGVIAKPGEELGLPDPKKIVITYISRQGGNRRKLIDDDHAGLVRAVKDLVARKEGWEFREVEAEKFSREEQIEQAAETTIMLGVHGNGLTHLVFMPPTRRSAVIELFYPGGFAHDYEWTSRALGMRHYGVWNDTYFTHPNAPQVDYPEGFQGDSIPVHGETVAKIIEDHIKGTI
ncbi:hypothetical protein BDN72DRAFT_801277 [Pluteus cervinus]|uniref:Uncharacterized protein n=1 Tax=Pluteus cervinus TaxID=181527 RepID=A0ACD3AIN2_9AGAR|nr:hypothetical protein BDN72DRAFT_801277 [Pluteus cervinus]